LINTSKKYIFLVQSSKKYTLRIFSNAFQQRDKKLHKLMDKKCVTKSLAEYHRVLSSLHSKKREGALTTLK
jgi:hypothetical protein